MAYSAKQSVKVTMNKIGHIPDLVGIRFLSANSNCPPARTIYLASFPGGYSDVKVSCFYSKNIIITTVLKLHRLFTIAGLNYRTELLDSPKLP